MALSNEDILNAIAEMSVMDVVALVEAMEEKFGVSAAAAVAAAPAAAAGGEAAAEEQTEFDVINEVIQRPCVALFKNLDNLAFFRKGKALVDKVVNGGRNQKLINISQAGVDFGQLIFDGNTQILESSKRRTRALVPPQARYYLLTNGETVQITIPQVHGVAGHDDRGESQTRAPQTKRHGRVFGEHECCR